MMPVPFGDLPPGAQYQRVNAEREIDLCVKLRDPSGEWNSVFLDGAFAGGFCSTPTNTYVRIVSVAVDLSEPHQNVFLHMLQPPGPELFVVVRMRNGERDEFSCETLTAAVTMAYVYLTRDERHEAVGIEEEGRILWQPPAKGDALASLRTFAGDNLIELPEE